MYRQAVLAVLQGPRRTLCAALACIIFAACPASLHAATASTALPVRTGNAALDAAEHVALGVLSRDAGQGLHLAAPYYRSAWIRDSFAWGMVPWSGSATDSLKTYTTSELTHWLKNPTADGLWITNPYSGWYDETPTLISAVADAYRITGDKQALAQALPRVEAAWMSMRLAGVRQAKGSSFLLYVDVAAHIAADWADQIARQGYATGLEALWYHATAAMVAIETAAGHQDRAEHYAYFAKGIARDINRLLWTTQAPMARNAAPAGAFGHFTGWTGPRDYFELDSNFLCILYGIASPTQSASIIRFTKAHAAYLLQVRVRNGMPARVVYGDYDPRDYARIHDKIADGTYQNAYWPSVGALVALGLARAGASDLALVLLRHMATAMIADGDTHEWYRAGGKPEGAADYQWPARMFLVALYAVYLGLDDSWMDSDDHGAPARKTRCATAGTADFQVHGIRYNAHVGRPDAGGSCLVRSINVTH